MIDIQKNVSLAQFTTFKIGGPAKFFVETFDKEQVIEAIKHAQENNLEIFVLSGGSNILVSDEGFDGLVIKISGTKIFFQNEKIECQAGARLAEIVLSSVRNELAGLEWAIGVPGTIGGAIRGNAGCFGGEIGESIESVEVLNTETLEVKKFSKTDCDFSYRNSVFKKNPKLIIVSATLVLQKGDREESQNRMREIITKRLAAQPKDPSAGSFFKNPIVEKDSVIKEFENETGATVKNGVIPAGWIIENLGLKGKKMGEAQISEKHANFIVNTGNATASDVIMLSSYIKQQARDKMGVQLQEEVQLIGF